MTYDVIWGEAYDGHGGVVGQCAGFEGYGGWIGSYGFKKSGIYGFINRGQREIFMVFNNSGVSAMFRDDLRHDFELAGEVRGTSWQHRIKYVDHHKINMQPNLNGEFTTS